ncbi:MAG: alpha-L-rhamnosidase N-terminal domain-containing protein [Clostridia bacterium]|nr:alpha-L-rhamnosidase N-terminal domain-containing protein [Clostridia bacterium]
MKVTHLRVNHMDSPVIDSLPEFSWRLESEKKSVTQTAYRIVVSDNAGLTWDSGKVVSNRQSFIVYEGAPLRSKTVYTVFITVWNNKCETAEAVSSFETGMLQTTDWTAKWIESTIPRNEAKLFTYGIVNPVVRFRRCFMLSGAVRSARLYASCYGCYRVKVNGVRPDDREFAPEFTPYDKILNYQTYDVTELVKPGANELTLLVGDGWFFCPQTAVNTEEAHERPAVIYELAVAYANGDTALICSDGSETVQTTNILFSDLFMGERQDRTLPDGAPQPVLLRKDFKLSHLRAQPLEPVRPAELIPAKRIYVSPNGETIVDFGQVLAGRQPFILLLAISALNRLRR